MRHYELLDAAISQRRLERGLSWGELAAQLGVSESALRNIRRGRNEPSELTARRIEDALQWTHGSVDEVLAGGEPTPAKDAQSKAELEELIADLTAVLEKVRRWRSRD